MPLERDSNGRTYIRHSNNQLTHYISNSFTDPWKPASTILIQHGFGRHSEFWYHWIPILSRTHRVIRRDLRGHGHSSFPTRQQDGTWESNYAYTQSTILDELIDTLDQLGLEKVHFLGESTGGMLGAILASKFPERVLSLTMCATPAYLPKAALEIFAFGRRDWAAACREMGARGWAEALGGVPGTVPVGDGGYLEWYFGQIGVSEGEGLAGYAEFLSGLDARPFLGGIRVPTLVLAPRGSAAVTVEGQRWLAGEIGGARLEVVGGEGHEIYVTQAERCQELFLEFTREVDGM